MDEAIARAEREAEREAIAKAELEKRFAATFERSRLSAKHKKATSSEPLFSPNIQERLLPVCFWTQTRAIIDKVKATVIVLLVAALFSLPILVLSALPMVWTLNLYIQSVQERSAGLKRALRRSPIEREILVRDR